MALTQVKNGGIDWTTGQIPFPATQNPSTDPNTLDDYEEGTWTPSDGSGAGLTFTVTEANYVKIGRLIIAFGYFAYPSNSNGSNANIAGFPYANESGQNFQGNLIYLNTGGATISIILINNTATAAIGSVAGAIAQNSGMSGAQIRFMVAYRSTT